MLSKSDLKGHLIYLCTLMKTEVIVSFSLNSHENAENLGEIYRNRRILFENRDKSPENPGNYCIFHKTSTWIWANPIKPKNPCFNKSIARNPGARRKSAAEEQSGSAAHDAWSRYCSSSAFGSPRQLIRCCSFLCLLRSSCTHSRKDVRRTGGRVETRRTIITIIIKNCFKSKLRPFIE